MLIKVFKENGSGKIELTLEQIKELLHEAYEEGVRSKGDPYVVIPPYHEAPANPYPCLNPNWWTVTCGTESTNTVSKK